MSENDLTPKTPGEQIDAAIEKNSAQDAQIETIKSDIEKKAGIDQSQQESLAVIREAILEIKSVLEAFDLRLKKLEAAPEDPPVEDPPVEDPPVEDPPVEAVTPFPVYVVAPGAEPVLIKSLDVTVPQGGSICVLEKVDAWAVDFTYAGRTVGEHEPIYCMAGGNQLPVPAPKLAAGTYPVTVRTRNRDGSNPFPTFTLSATFAAPPPVEEPPVEDPPVEEPPPPPPPGTRAQVQVGPWFSWLTNPEQPYTNLLAASGPPWVRYGANWAIIARLPELIAQGHVDPETGYPLPGAPTLSTEGLFDGESAALFDGDWKLCWEGEATFFLQGQPSALLRREGNSWLFTRDRAGGRTPGNLVINVSNVQTKLTDIALFRVEDEAAYRAGEVWRPAFKKAVSRYDIIRTMDLQSSNSAMIVTAGEIPPPSYPWNGEALGGRYEGPPLERLLDLAVECKSALWLQAPAHLGFPGTPVNDGNVMGSVAKTNAQAMLKSPEIDAFADRLVKALETTGYPSKRALHLSVSNEVWNWRFRQTAYYNGFGEGLYGAGNRFRYAYGAHLTRIATAVEAALKRAGRTQEVVYVIEGQAAWADLNWQALTGARDWANGNGFSWAELAPKFGLSVASYWGGGNSYTAFKSREEWTAALAADSVKLGKDFADWFINAPAQGDNFSLDWTSKKMKENAAIGNNFGVRFIGAYEGGPHLEYDWDSLPAYLPVSWYREWLWGPEGARVNSEMQRRLSVEFPGTILSNYALGGSTGGQPWFEGPLGANNPYAKSWEPFLRAAE